ncbi:MAG: metallophosphoesterase [Novosphingobium sp.]
MVPLSFTRSATSFFAFAGQEMRLVLGRALHWVEEGALLVADLHLEKGSFFARAGQMVPPYDSRATLEALALALRETGARKVFCLGDSFHDREGAVRLEPHAAGMLDALTRATEWVWITGNHDPVIASPVGGERLPEIAVRGLCLRHEARPAAGTAPKPGSAADGETESAAGEAEISGHFHPRLAITLRGRRITRPCAVTSERRMILPAFGALTGGLDAGAPAILAALQPARVIDALAPAGGRLLRYPLWRDGHSA